MIQARRRTKKQKKTLLKHASMQCLSMLLVGTVIGVLATILWKGVRSDSNGIGSGIRQIIKSSEVSDKDIPEKSKEKVAVKQADQQKTSYDFFTILPSIEVVVSEQPEEPDKSAEKGNRQSPTTENNTNKSLNAYMLQAGSYRKSTDAERMRANLALKGISSQVQKVSIQGRGNFYRVRIGPFDSYTSMVDTDKQLAEADIKSLRLKISRGN